MDRDIGISLPQKFPRIRICVKGSKVIYSAVATGICSWEAMVGFLGGGCLSFHIHVKKKYK